MVCTVQLQASTVGLTAAIQDANFLADALLVRTLASIINVIFTSLHSELQYEALYGSRDLNLRTLLRFFSGKIKPLHHSKPRGARI